MNRGIGILAILMAMGQSSVSGQTVLLYKDSTQPVTVRVDDLIKRTTLDEKVAQLQSQLLFHDTYKNRNFSVGYFRAIVDFMHKNGPLTAGTCAAIINEDTRQSIQASRLGIPVLQQGEALHGANWGMATVFPQCIGLAASFDDSLEYRIGQVVAKELRAVGVRQVYAPVINIARDPRWGRMQETFGEDVCLTSRMGVAYTKALEQGGIIATVKHFVDNYGAGGHDSYASDNSWRTLREVYLEPFRACVQEGGAGAVMAAYNSVDGIPCSNNKTLLTDILRNEWGFKGVVVSDYGGVRGVFSAHQVARSYAEAQAQCLEAGMDVELANGYPDLPSLVKSGRVKEGEIDTSVRRVLTAKIALGLFDRPYVDTAAANRIVRSTAHRALALEAARKTMTLLKNKNYALPLNARLIKRVGVFGPAASVLSLGDYSGPGGGWKGSGAVTPIEGLSKRFEGKAEVVLYQPGTDLTAFAKTCDVLIFFAVIQEGEARDRSRLALPATAAKAAESKANAVVVNTDTDSAGTADQEQMIKTLAATGVKTIVVLQNGSPIDISPWGDKVDAILEAWYPGEQGGTAIAETLFGDNNPGGRLPVSWPRHAGQIPIYYAMKPSGRGYDYLDDDGKPEFPFGYGLSYTACKYSNLLLPSVVKAGDSVVVQVTLSNAGEVKGDEVVQLYLHQKGAEVVRPIKELKAFKRVTLEPGEHKVVSLTLPARSFGHWDKDLKFVVRSGVFDVMISSDAEHDLLKGEVRVE
jgi:beta-glucosidase